MKDDIRSIKYLEHESDDTCDRFLVGRYGQNESVFHCDKIVELNSDGLIVNFDYIHAVIWNGILNRRRQ